MFWRTRKRPLTLKEKLEEVSLDKSVQKWWLFDEGLSPSFLFSRSEDYFDFTDQTIKQRVTDGKDYLIRHFESRRIGQLDGDMFRRFFSTHYKENKEFYQKMFDEAIKVVDIDGWNQYSEEVEETGHAEGNRTGTVDSSDTGTIGIEHDTTVKRTGTVTSEDNGSVARTINEESTHSNNTSANGTTTNDLTDTSTSSGTTSNTTTNNLETTESGYNRQLVSDTPQSIVDASTTGNPANISWEYASGLTDSITNNTVENTGTVAVSGSDETEGTVKRTGTVTTEDTGTDAGTTTTTGNNSDVTETTGTITNDLDDSTTGTDTTTRNLAGTVSSNENDSTDNNRNVTRSGYMIHPSGVLVEFIDNIERVRFFERLYNDFDKFFDLQMGR